MTEIVGIPIGILTPSALLGLAVFMLFTGRLWTNAAYREKAKEADKWYQAYTISEKARAEAEAQSIQLLEQGKTTHNIVVAMFGLLERKRQAGDADVAVPTSK